MKKTAFIILAISMLTACSQIDQIPYCCPKETPITWCQNHPCLSIDLGSHSFTLSTPSSSIIVYTLGILTLLVGIRLSKASKGSKSLFWWGISLIFWGVAAICAGTSYQAFSYEIKCRGLEVCQWTSRWELIYLILETISVNLMFIAVSYSSIKTSWQNRIRVYAIINTIVYTGVVIVGSSIPNWFMISFELMILFTGPTFLAMFFINLRNYLQTKVSSELVLAGAWIGLGIVMILYYGYYLTGITGILWQRGIWFSQNDVLHVGLIVWILYLARYLPVSVSDIE